MWILNYAQVNLEEVLTFLVGHQEVLNYPIKEVLKELSTLVVAQGVICVANNY